MGAKKRTLFEEASDLFEQGRAQKITMEAERQHLRAGFLEVLSLLRGH